MWGGVCRKRGRRMEKNETGFLSLKYINEKWEKTSLKSKNKK